MWSGPFNLFIVMNKVVRVTKTEFELDNGDAFSIEPEFDEDMSPEDFLNI